MNKIEIDPFCINPDYYEQHNYTCKGCFNEDKCKAEVEKGLQELSEIEKDIDEIIKNYLEDVAIHIVAVDIDPKDIATHCLKLKLCERCPIKDNCYEYFKMRGQSDVHENRKK